MSRLFFVGGCRRTLLVWFGVFLCFISGLNISAQSLYEDAPILISQPNSTRALTVQPSRRGLDTNVIQPGSRTRITFFVTNLKGLMDGEDATAFRADMEDSRHFRYPLDIISFEQTAERKWVYALTVRLNSQIGNVGDVLMRVTWRGMSSNRVRVAIGQEGGKIQDDAGAAPTPMPDNPPVEAATESLIGLPWSGDRVRFMEQAAFGPKASLESRLRRTSYSTWIAEQTEEKRAPDGAIRYSTFPYPPNLAVMPTNPAANCGAGTACFRDGYTMYPLQRWFFKEALYGEDQQLRRRVSWALSQIWVVSGRETIQPVRMRHYLEILDRNAFGNYRNLMEEMTLNPAMGNYLDMASSTRQNPNENYAREILQLFSIGIYMLNQNGTVQFDGQGNPVPSYDQNIVNGFTKVFTGWTFCELTGPQCPNRTLVGPNFIDPMIITNPNNHDPTAKQVLSYPGSSSTIPAGLPPDVDMKHALDNIFYHPNVGPFVSKLLIQQLVTSNPTPAYVGRVAAVFNSNGAGIRGDMKAVVRAILLDPEARGNNKTDPDYGKLREPVLYVTNVLRPFNPAAQANAVAAENCAGLSDGMINNSTLPLDQDVLNPPTVFNYYPMDYIIPNTPLAGPEFGIFSTGTALKRPNFIHQIFGPGAGGATGIIVVNNPAAGNYTPCGTRIDLARLQPLVTADPTGGTLVDTLNREMMHGAMSPQMRDYIMTAVQAVAAGDSLKRVRTAVYLVATAPQFQVQR